MSHATSSQQIEQKIVHCRLIFSIAVAVAVVLDPLQPQLNPWLRLIGGEFPMDPDLLGTIFLHSAYSAFVYLVFRSNRMSLDRFASATTAGDVLFAAAIVFVTEGRSILFTPVFTFAIVESGVRWGLRRTMAVTCASLGLWFAMIVVWSPGGAFFYLMRPVYLLIVGYLVGYLGEARLKLQGEVQTLAAAEDRLRIARDLHDGCAQVLAAVNLQLESARNLAEAGRTAELVSDLEEMQRSINAEHDELRAYLRTLAGMSTPRVGVGNTDPRIRVSIDIDAPGAFVDQVLRIVREGVTNVRRHAAARSAAIHAGAEDGRIAISIDDDGRGFDDADQAPWSIASRVKELGGSLQLERGEPAGAHITISLPST
jgi:signal transduction histidine kinase